MSEKYDVVIIGAGIGGLVCGCYLAKAGLKVLIVEQQNKPGGYCTSFERDGYRFDVGVRYFGGINNGTLGKILNELEIKKEIKFNQFDPTDKIITPDNVTYIRINPHDTILEFKKNFHKEKNNIERFFSFVMKNEFVNVYTKVKNMTFSDMLDRSFNDPRLKFIMNAIIFSNTGLISNEIRAIFAIILFRVYLLDPGYYPNGGIQVFPNVLAAIFKKAGGDLILSKRVIKILISNQNIKGVMLEDKREINTDSVISNSDATQLFRQLLNIKCREAKIISRLKPSVSAFIVYLGLNINLKDKLDRECDILFFSKNNIENYSRNALDKPLNKNINGIICELSSLHDAKFNSFKKSSMSIAVQVPYKTKEFWDSFRDDFSEKLIEQVENHILGFSFRENIDLKLTATPYTLYEYTSNFRGALFGWASIKNQSSISILPPQTSIKGLYLTGHWCTIGFGQGGISGVALSGRKTAELVLKDMKKEWNYSLLKP